MSNLFTATTASEVEEYLARGDNLEEVRGSVWSKATPLISSIKRGNKEVFLSLLQHGAKIGACHEESRSAVQVAAKEGHVDMIKALVKAGADVNENRGFGTPLFIASQDGSVDVVDCLLDLKVDLESPDSSGETPLMAASWKGHIDVADRLLAAGASVHSLSESNWTALSSAASQGRLGIIDRLVIHGANINHQDEELWTPLMLASYDGYTPVVDRLLGLGCDVNIVSENGWSALMYTCQRSRYPEIVKILLAHGADTQIEDNDSKRAIDLTQSQEIKDLLQEHESKKQAKDLEEPPKKRHRSE